MRLLNDFLFLKVVKEDRFKNRLLLPLLMKVNSQNPFAGKMKELEGLEDAAKQMYRLCESAKSIIGESGLLASEPSKRYIQGSVRVPDALGALWHSAGQSDFVRSQHEEMVSKLEEALRIPPTTRAVVVESVPESMDIVPQGYERPSWVPRYFDLAAYVVWDIGEKFGNKSGGYLVAYKIHFYRTPSEEGMTKQGQTHAYDRMVFVKGDIDTYLNDAAMKSKRLDIKAQKPLRLRDFAEFYRAVFEKVRSASYHVEQRHTGLAIQLNNRRQSHGRRPFRVISGNPA